MPSEAAVQLKNINPLGAVDLPLIGRTLEPGEVFEVDDKVGKALLEQTGNYEAVAKAAKAAAKVIKDAAVQVAADAEAAAAEVLAKPRSAKPDHGDTGQETQPIIDPEEK